MEVIRLVMLLVLSGWIFVFSASGQLDDDSSVSEPAAQTTPHFTVDQVWTDQDFMRLPRVLVSTRVRVVDARDRLPLEGVQLVSSPGGQSFEIVLTDQDGFVTIMTSGTIVGLPVSVTVLSRQELTRGLGKEPPPLTVRKQGVEIDFASASLPAVARSEKMYQADQAEPYIIEVPIDLQGMFVQRDIAVTFDVSQEHALTESVKKRLLRERAFVYVDDASNGGEAFSLDANTGKVRVGPVPSSVKLAYLKIGAAGFPFEVAVNKAVEARLARPPYQVGIEYRSPMRAGALLWLAGLRGGFYEQERDATAIRLSDGLVMDMPYVGSASLKLRENFPTVDARIEEGTFAFLPLSFGGGPYHFMFIRAIREGIDVAALGVPVATFNAENPTAKVVVDGAQAMELYNRVKKALDDKLAADAAANPAPTPEDPTDEPPAPPTP
jgi:hypothetical protein